MSDPAIDAALAVLLSTPPTSERDTLDRRIERAARELVRERMEASR